MLLPKLIESLYTVDMRKKEVKEVIIKLDAPRMGRPRKDPDERHHTTLSIVGTIDEINYIREQAKLSGKSLSRYIIESVI